MSATKLLLFCFIARSCSSLSASAGSKGQWAVSQALGRDPAAILKWHLLRTAGRLASDCWLCIFCMCCTSVHWYTLMHVALLHTTLVYFHASSLQSLPAGAHFLPSMQYGCCRWAVLVSYYRDGPIKMRWEVVRSSEASVMLKRMSWLATTCPFVGWYLTSMRASVFGLPWNVFNI